MLGQGGHSPSPPPNLAHLSSKFFQGNLGLTFPHVVLLLVDAIGSIVISLSRCCLPNDNGLAPTRNIISNTVSQKNWATFIFTVTLANVGRFLKFFYSRNQKEIADNKKKNFPPHLNCVAALPCKTNVSMNVNVTTTLFYSAMQTFNKT